MLTSSLDLDLDDTCVKYGQVMCHVLFDFFGCFGSPCTTDPTHVDRSLPWKSHWCLWSEQQGRRCSVLIHQVIKAVTAGDIRNPIVSFLFKAPTNYLSTRWCSHLAPIFYPPTKQKLQFLRNFWQGWCCSLITTTKLRSPSITRSWQNGFLPILNQITLSLCPLATQTVMSGIGHHTGKLWAF